MAIEMDGAHHLRLSTRYKLFQPTEIRVENVPYRAHILNLSAGGALIFATDPPTTGATVELQCGERPLCARVAWTAEDRFGVAFLSPLTDAYVSALVAAQDALAAARLGLRWGHEPAQLN